MLIDTHAHPHMEGYQLEPGEFFAKAQEAGVEQLICVGTSAEDSRRAIAFAAGHEGCHASVGLHPHDAKTGTTELDELVALVDQDVVVAVGECGLDYYYNHSPAADQEQALRGQIELALAHGLPLIFHVREAFDEFFRILDDYSGIRGVIHSFTADLGVLQRCLQRDLYIGVNGIMTFTKEQSQLEAARQIPPDNLLLETDAPFLTPHPFRGTVNHSGQVRVVAEFLADLRSEPLAALAAQTTENARNLFKL